MEHDLDHPPKDDTNFEEGVEAAWNAEIARRIREAEEGKVALIPWAEVRRRLTAK
jgi:hypothetical protein